jgi:hypothetical protein
MDASMGPAVAEVGGEYRGSAKPALAGFGEREGQEAFMMAQ